MNESKIKELLVDMANGRWVTFAELQKHAALGEDQLKPLLHKLQKSTAARIDVEVDDLGHIIAVRAHRIVPSTQSSPLKAAQRRKSMGLMFAPESFAFRSINR